ncbi:MAG: thioredoxin family protein [Saprospiraceae bacterium]|nr:thioredoxin family protein [Saprospiraceae bacterium]
MIALIPSEAPKPYLKFYNPIHFFSMTTYYRRFLSIVFFALLTLPSFAEEVNFIKDNVRTAIDRAAAEGKLVFLDFWADYCSPCKLMEKYTFTDPSVIQRMNGSYVPVRINIETFDGYDLKAQYNVKLLPTIIVLNSKGKQVARFEESMSASKLNEILTKYDTKQNRKKFAKPTPAPIKAKFSQDFDIVAKPNVSSVGLSTRLMDKNALVPSAVPSVTAPVTPSVAPATSNESKNSTDKITFRSPPVFGIAPAKPTTNSTTNVPNSYNKVAVNRSVTKVEKPITFSAPNNTNTANNATVNRTVRVNNTTNTASKGSSLASITSGYFTIQVGNFAKKDNADRVSKVMKTQMAGKQKVFLLSGGSENLVTHRVMVGGFKTYKEAAEFKIKNQIEGFVQNYGSYIKEKN